MDITSIANDNPTREEEYLNTYQTYVGKVATEKVIKKKKIQVPILLM